MGEDGDLEHDERSYATTEEGKQRHPHRRRILLDAPRGHGACDYQPDRAGKGDEDGGVAEDGDHAPSWSSPYGWSGSYDPSSDR